jgi:hypothetical protein
MKRSTWLVVLAFLLSALTAVGDDLKSTLADLTKEVDK